MPNINQAYLWGVNTCNMPNVGYSQTYRNQRTINGITYYDCSSFIYYALIAGGFALVPSAWPFTTSNMRSVLVSLGFVKGNINDPWLPGDVVWRTGHTEMVYQGRKTMGAHSSSYPLAQQVSINTFEAAPGSWTEIYRFGGGATGSYDWISGNRYLSMPEMQNNAYIFYSNMYYRGWSLNAVAGTCGNMESESTINPGISQSLSNNPALGWGLVQWTPSTNYTTWADANGYDHGDGDAQCVWIDEVTVPFGQWIQTSAYPISFDEYKVSTETPEYLASAFLKNFERAGVEVEEERRTQAKYWYEYLSGLSPSQPPPSPSTKKKGLPVWMMCRYF